MILINTNLYVYVGYKRNEVGRNIFSYISKHLYEGFHFSTIINEMIGNKHPF